MYEPSLDVLFPKAWTGGPNEEIGKMRMRVGEGIIGKTFKDNKSFILKEFPLENYGDMNNYLSVLGSKELIEQFIKIDNRKLDIKERLENVFIDKVSSNKQLVLLFTEDSLNAEGVYRFTYEYLDMAFKMGKFSSYCLENDLEQLLVDTTRKLCKLQPRKEFQYRLIEENEEWLIRGVTSVRYNNYDNHLAIYLTLLALHNHAQATHQWYALDKAYISDSEIVIMFDAMSPRKIVGVGNLYVGLILTNNEIKEKVFSLEYRFRLEDEDGNEFGAIPEGEEPIFTIRHDSNLKSVKDKLRQLKNLEGFKDRIVELVLAISHSPYLSEDRIFAIFKKIKLSRTKYSPETKQAFKNLQEEQFIDNSLHIIKAFNRLNEIVTDVEEKIHLERLFFEVCMDIKKERSRK
ncbi:hypothetical protein FQP34_18525 [Peribacillus simplex]|uniref:Uncharacterized protein n=1 Tax=Peribacillus simplex TaxID=1478 RepID=A0A8B5XV78_9BACI|nr:hypothetical protein [Peribacillus simplex]TVX78549.1 hypothetical protein FQP34_18525 [Peribacillus simplex]